MVDIHCHLLPGLDDGPDTLEESLEMAEGAIADGITHIVATPHANSRYPFVPDLVQRRRDEIAGHTGDRLSLATGCDFHMSFENLQDAYAHPTKYTLNHKSYLLVEFADFGIPASVDDALHQLQLHGMDPIVTHPERNGLIASQPARLEKWVERGCYVQVTAGSLLGRFGPTAKRAAENWIEQGLVHFVATDAHNTRSRPLRLSEARAAVAARWGQDIAAALFFDNPLAAIEGRGLPWVPEPVRAAPRRKRFFFF
jgi:protein-tyrosine phosphatase